MAAKLEHLDGLKRQLSVSILPVDFSKQYQQKVANAAQKAHVKGFRPGKVPAAVIEQKFGESLLHEAAADLVDSTFQSEIQAQKIKIAGMPKIDVDFTKIKKDAGFDYVATFEVYPEIQLKDLTDQEIESITGEVTDEDVNSMLVQLRTQHAEWVDVDRAAKLGDRVQIDFDGELDGKPLEQGSAKNHQLELGSKSMIPGFEEGIIGAKKGETKTLNIAFPENYHVEHLRAKPVKFEVVVHQVQEPKLPALDDAFAEKLGIKDGVDALKKQMKERMQSELTETARAQSKGIVLDKLMSLNPLVIPDALLDAEVAHLQEMTRQQLRQYRRLSEADAKKVPLAREPYLEEAKKRVALGLLLAEVIRDANIQVDEKKVHAHLKEMAARYGDVDAILPIILKNKQMVSDVEAFVLEEAAIAFLLSKARVSELKKSYDAIMNANK